MPMRTKWRGAAQALAWLALTSPALADLAVDKAIIFSRHGVRPPTNQKTLDPLSVDPWPSWSVADGNLTPHGAAAATLMGQYYRSRLTRSGTLESSACPIREDLFAWADEAERTRSTADAILEGMYPGCGLKAGFNRQTAAALFHPVSSGVAPLNQIEARQGILKALGGSLDAAKTRYSQDFARLAEVLHGPDRTACSKAKLPTGCSLIDLPWTISTENKGRSVALKGPLDWAGTVGEVIRMEYASNFPMDQVGWGRVADAEGVKNILALHSAYYDATLRVPVIARANASQILNQISLALRDGTPIAGDGGPPIAKTVLLVGHDTNIATMQASMKVQWLLSGYPDNDTPPAGAFLFERLRDTATGVWSVRLFYMAQNLDQIRNLTSLTGDGQAPEIAALTLPGCPTAPTPCDLEVFVTSLRAKIDPAAVSAVSYKIAPGPARN